MNSKTTKPLLSAEASSDPRWEAYRAIGQILNEPAVHVQDSKSDAPDFTSADAALFTELFHGIFREWDFLAFVMSEANIKIRRRGSFLLWALASYQILFLDRIPRYAVFSELKKMGKGIKLAEPEIKHLFWAVSEVERRRGSLLKARDRLLKEFTTGHVLQGFPFQTLPPDFRKWFPKGMHQVLGSLRTRGILLGYLSPENTPQPDPEGEKPKFLSSRTRYFQAGKTPELLRALQQGTAAIQGDASLFLCDQVALLIAEKAASKAKLKICELHAGKGGKFFSTIHALQTLTPPTSCEIEWWATDSSPRQIEMLEAQAKNSTENSDLLKNVRLQTRVWDWSKGQAGPNHHFELPEGMPKDFDIVLVDAPCSGLGTIAKNPEILLRVNSKAIGELAQKQGIFLKQGLELLGVNGELFYSVCTFTTQEAFDVAKSIAGQAKVESQILILPQAAKEFQFAFQDILYTPSPEAFFFMRLRK